MMSPVSNASAPHAARHEKNMEPVRDFSAWVKATSSPDDLHLGIPGFSYADLYQATKLAELTERFHAYLAERDPAAFDGLKKLEAAGGELADPVETSNVLIAAAPHLAAFVAKLFQIEAEWQAQKHAILASDPVWAFKREFAKKRLFKADAGKGWEAANANAVARIVLEAAGAPASVLGSGTEDEELEVAKATLRLFEIDDTARKRAKAGGAVWREELAEAAERVAASIAKTQRARELGKEALETPFDASAPHVRAGAISTFALAAIEAWLASRRDDHHDGAHAWHSLHEPKKLVAQSLVQIRRPDPSLPELFVGPEEHRREREGFGLTDRRGSRRYVQGEVDYCLYCHDRNKDSCSKGMHDAKTDAVKPNALGVPLNGCPLEEKISEFHTVRHDHGDALAGLALICIDNPMLPGTGHRICNDCMKACIFQKQEPVNIPQTETGTLTDVLSLPWGLEIYGLLTRWNPLNVKWPHPQPLNGKSALVVGMGPAGYTLAHHLSRAGFAVVGIDGLKIEPLPVELTGDETHAPRPIRDYSKVQEELDERIVLGFGGVSEYGITVRWDKNFLSVVYMTVARNRRIRIYGGVRFGGTITIEDAWKYGFDHVALAAGAGKPTLVPIKNNLARGIRQASDFLMALQLTGAYKRSSLANMQVELPAIVIGGGLTAIDTATELLAYYQVQCAKTAERFRKLVAEQGEAVLKGFSAEELAFLRTQCEHADALAKEHAAANAEGRKPRIQELLQSWGGVSLVYRKTILDSPAYRLNHEEVEKCLEEGVRIIENLSPTEAVLDGAGALTAVKFERQKSENGKWSATGEIVELPARTMCVAAGTSPNTTIEKEVPGVFALDARKQYFLAHVAEKQPDGTIKTVPSNDLRAAFFTSYAKDGKTVSFYGDNHPYYAGSVVKAMASAKNGFAKVAELYADPKGVTIDQAEWRKRRDKVAALFKTLDQELVAKVHDVVRLTPTIVEVIVHAPAAARNFRPGQFYRLQNFEELSPIVDGTRLTMEGLALTGAWVDKEKGLLSTIVLEMGASSRLCAMLKPGDPVILMGPTGTPTEIEDRESVLLAGGGLGNAVLFSIAREMKQRGDQVVYFAGYRKGEDVFHQADIEVSTDQVIWCTDSGAEIVPRRPQDRHFRGNIVQAMIAYAKGELGEHVDTRKTKRIIAIGSDKMMAAVQRARHAELQPYLDPKHIGIGSINSPMQCMMKEICAQCLQKHHDPVTGKESVVFSCTNQDQELDRVDWKHLDQRLRSNTAQEKLTNAWLTHLLAERRDILRV